MTKVLSFRAPDDLAEWADEYSKARGVTRQALLLEGLRSFREDCATGVPDLVAKPEPAKPSAPASVRSLVSRHPGLVLGSSLRQRDPEAMARQAKLNAAKERAS